MRGPVVPTARPLTRHARPTRLSHTEVNTGRRKLFSAAQSSFISQRPRERERNSIQIQLTESEIQ
jgi:hypothetical protein